MTYQGKTAKNGLRDMEADGEKPKKAPDKSEKYLETQNDPLQIYLKESKRHPLLTKIEQKTAFERYKNFGDEETKKLLIVSNLRLVIKIALQYHGYTYFSLVDLVQEGNMGLIRAIKRYDPDKNAKFSYYAAYWIKAYIMNYIMKNWSIVKFVTTEKRRKLFDKLRKEKRRLVKEDVDPDTETIAQNLDIEVKEVLEMEKILTTGGDLSLDDFLLKDGGTRQIDFMPSDIDTEKIVFDNDLKKRGRALFKRFRETLSERELIIFDNRLYCEKALTLKEIGHKIGVSRERIRQMEKGIYKKLHKFKKEEEAIAV